MTTDASAAAGDHGDHADLTGLTDADALHARVAAVCDIPRALTGDGVRALLHLISTWGSDMEVTEVPSGSPALDWTVPDEWNLQRARLIGPDGAVVADSDDHILQVVGYSEPVSRTVSLAELQDGHLHSLEDQPELIPWRTSYYRRTWGFCLPHRVRETLVEGEYTVQIDATLQPGHLTYGEVVVPGQTDDEVLITAHTCHPAMANDNASGIVVAAAVAQALSAQATPRLTHRFLFAPGTIGAITWLSRNPDAIARNVGGLVLSGLGDPGERLTYKSSRRGNAPMDVAMRLALRDLGRTHNVLSYSPWGYDERQFNSLGFDLGVGLLNRTPHGSYAEYHTSADTPEFVSKANLAESARTVMLALEILNGDGTYLNQRPHGEPQLGRRGLWPSVGGQSAQIAQRARLWVLAESDGRTSLTDIARTSGLPFAALREAAEAMSSTDLLASTGRGILRGEHDGAGIAPTADSPPERP